jgi:threonine dehydratase
VSADPEVTVAHLRRAARRIAAHVVRTPLRRSEGLSRLAGTEVFLKLETMQHTGAFKLRGAAHAVLQLSARQRARGVVTFSTGNHGRALAWIAWKLGVPCTVCLSGLVPQGKRDRLTALGATLVVTGADQDAAADAARAIAAARGMVLVPPFDDAAVIAGQGTIALELAADRPDLAAVLIPLSGGGLFAGVATGLATLAPGAARIAVSSAACPAMVTAIAAGRPVPVAEHPSLADSLGGGIGSANRHSLAITRALMTRNITVGDPAIARAMRWAFAEERLVLEGAGAAGIAAFLDTPDLWSTGPVAILVTGDNVEPALLRAVLDGQSGLEA